MALHSRFETSLVHRCHDRGFVVHFVVSLDCQTAMKYLDQICELENAALRNIEWTYSMWLHVDDAPGAGVGDVPTGG
eukprot:7306799-Pyramimonas_sp.AAC.1